MSGSDKVAREWAAFKRAIGFLEKAAEPELLPAVPLLALARGELNGLFMSLTEAGDAAAEKVIAGGLSLLDGDAAEEEDGFSAALGVLMSDERAYEYRYEAHEAAVGFLSLSKAFIQLAAGRGLLEEELLVEGREFLSSRMKLFQEISLDAHISLPRVGLRAAVQRKRTRKGEAILSGRYLRGTKEFSEGVLRLARGAGIDLSAEALELMAERLEKSGTSLWDGRAAAYVFNLAVRNLAHRVRAGQGELSRLEADDIVAAFAYI